MKVLNIAVTALLLASLIAVGNAQQANYAGAAKIVLEIMSLNTCPYSSYSSEWYPSYYNVLVIYSGDPAIKQGSEYKMEIDEQMNGYWGITSGITPKEFVDGTIIGINDYSLNDGMIHVGVGADPKDQTAWDNAWKQKITILGTSNTSTMNGLQGGIGSSTPSLFSTPFHSNSLMSLPSETISGLPSPAQDSAFPMADQFTRMGTTPKVPSGYTGSVPGYYLAYGYPSVSTPRFPFNSPMLENTDNFAF